MCSASKASAVSDDGQQPEVTSHAAEMGRRLGGTGGEHAVLEALKQEVARLENSVVHLDRSNAELDAAMLDDPDPDYREAIGENIMVLAQYRLHIIGMRAEIEALEQALGPSAPARVPPAGASNADGSSEASQSATPGGSNQLQGAPAQPHDPPPMGGT
mmetsp:Transcript_13553/g.40983  ORF Transcript_13553/g.40983 Transcript_13553/m.40983 type:complete len:159 (-) Transcript_13553:1768-2244(-)